MLKFGKITHIGGIIKKGSVKGAYPITFLSEDLIEPDTLEFNKPIDFFKVDQYVIVTQNDKGYYSLSRVPDEKTAKAAKLAFKKLHTTYDPFM